MSPGAIPLGWDAIVPAGGESRRMGTDKLALDIGGLPIFERVLQAVAGAERLIVVGPQRHTSRPAIWCQEDPVGSGPAAALRAGLEHVVHDFVVVLAADQPFTDRDVVADLLHAIGDADGAVAVDDAGAPQWLCSAWHADALRRAPLAPNVSLRASIGALRWKPVNVAPQSTLDCDTPDDLRRARELAP